MRMRNGQVKYSDNQFMRMPAALNLRLPLFGERVIWKRAHYQRFSPKIWHSRLVTYMLFRCDWETGFIAQSFPDNPRFLVRSARWCLLPIRVLESNRLKKKFYLADLIWYFFVSILNWFYCLAGCAGLGLFATAIAQAHEQRRSKTVTVAKPVIRSFVIVSSWTSMVKVGW